MNTSKDAGPVHGALPAVEEFGMAAQHDSRPLGALFDAAAGLAAAGQQTVLDRMDLVRAEANEDVRALVADSAWLAGAGALTAVGWALVVVGAALSLAKAFDPGSAVALVGLPHLVVGLVVAGWTLRKMRLASGGLEPAPWRAR